MSKSKAGSRSVHTDALETLGTIIDDTARRDAIHLAVEPAVAGCRLRPGEPVFLHDNAVATNEDGENYVGIVDPFLESPVKKGQRFWLVVFPRKITSLRHVWEHPEFPPSEPALKPEPVQHGTVADKYKLAREAAKNFIQDEADRIGVGFDELIEHAGYYVHSGEYWTEGGRFESEYIVPEFWSHYEVWTGEAVKEEDRGSFFSCTC